MPRPRTPAPRDPAHVLEERRARGRDLYHAQEPERRRRLDALAQERATRPKVWTKADILARED